MALGKPGATVYSGPTLQHITALTFVWAVLSMMLKDAVGVFLVVAEARGEAILAGALDGASDLATVLVTIVGAGSVLSNGWNVMTIGILATLMLTSTIGTYFWTLLARGVGGPRHTHAEFLALVARVKALEESR